MLLILHLHDLLRALELTEAFQTDFLGGILLVRGSHLYIELQGCLFAVCAVVRGADTFVAKRASSHSDVETTLTKVILWF